MPIRYSIVKNTLPDGRKVYRARVHTIRVVSFEEVMSLVADSNTTVSKSDVRAVCEGLGGTVADLLAEGYSVEMPWSFLRPSIRGTFHGETDEFDPNRHQIVASATAGERVREKIETSARAEKVRREIPAPALNRYYDLVTGESDSLVTPDGDAHLYGGRLKFDRADPEQGIFFVAAGGAETRVEIVTLNKPAQLFFRVPALAPGQYSLRVRARPYGSPRWLTGVLQAVLTVAGSANRPEGNPGPA